MILIHRGVMDKFLSPLLDALAENGVISYLEPSLFPCDKKGVQKASETEFFHEFLEKKLTIWPVQDMEEAISLIHQHGSGHTECIITENEGKAEEFLKKVDSAGVYWNASTRFADGYRYGFGAEIGVSTNRIHARGPVGLEGLCIYKYILRGSGQIVEDYQNGKSKFTHKLLHHDR